MSSFILMEKLRKMTRLALATILFALSTGLVAQNLENISLQDAGTGTKYELRSLKSAKASVIIFWGNRCAYNGYYLGRLKQLATEFNSLGVPFILVNSNRNKIIVEESPQEMKKYLQNNRLNLPYLVDANQTLKESLKASRSPEAFLLTSDLEIFYSGAIDDSPQSEGDVGHPYLREAILSLLANKKPTVAQTRPTGCLIR